MKIVLFRNGKRGVAAKLPGEDPDVELTDLLGGKLRMKALTSKLIAVTLKDAEELGLGHRYNLHVKEHTTPVYGECAVVALNVDGTYRDLTLVETAAVEVYVRCV